MYAMTLLVLRILLAQSIYGSYMMFNMSAIMPAGIIGQERIGEIPCAIQGTSLDLVVSNPSTYPGSNVDNLQHPFLDMGFPEIFAGLVQFGSVCFQGKSLLRR